MGLVLLIMRTEIIQKSFGGVALFVSAGEKSRFNRKHKLFVKENCHGITFPSQASELCHLTVACMKRWGLRASYVSADTNADAGQNA